MKRSRFLLALFLVLGLALSAIAVTPPGGVVINQAAIGQVSMGTITFSGLVSSYGQPGAATPGFDTLMITIPVVNSSLYNRTIEYLSLTLAPWQYNTPATYKIYSNIVVRPGTSYFRWVATANINPNLGMANYGYGLLAKLKLTSSSSVQILYPTVARSTLAFLSTF